MKDYDDKDLVIVAAFGLCVVALINTAATPEAIELTKMGLSGLFGIAVGRSLKHDK